ncbi:MAG: hypothetical protein AB1553_02105 [Nitrospirota bacterium]
MRGIPAHLNTRHDVEQCVELALAGELDRAELKKRIERLLSDDMVWNFKTEVDDTYQPAQNEKVITEDVGGITKHFCFELVSNPAAVYLRMGFAKAELQAFINQL